MRERQEKGVPHCPFCSAELARPVETVVDEMDKALSGVCKCGALYFADPTGKNVGTLMAQALVMAAARLGKAVEHLDSDRDYRDAILSYDWRNHRSAGESSGFRDGFGRLYIIQIRKTGSA